MNTRSAAEPATRNRTTVERTSERELVVTRTIDGPPPSVFEAWFLSAAHTDVELDRIVAALPTAVRAAADAPRPQPAG